MLHTGSNTQYAIAPLEVLFYETGLALGSGDSNKVHFAYRNLDNGDPRTLPIGFRNVISFDFKDTSRRNISRLVDYVRRNKIEVVTIFDIQPVSPVFRYLRQAGVRSIITYWGAPISSLMPRWRLLFKKLAVQLSRSKVDGLIFESQAMADLAIFGRGVPRPMIDIIPLGVDIDRFYSNPSDYVYEAIGALRETKVFIYAGHMEPRKGVRTLVEAAIELLMRRKRRDASFVICGNKGDESKPYEQLYAGMGLDPWIKFGGYRSDMVQLYQSSFCGVIPSSGWDSFPRTPVEMAACGIPVIASRLQGLPEAVLDKETGLLFQPGNAGELADRIETLLDDPQLASTYGRNGRKRCEDELNLEVQRSRFLSVLCTRIATAKPTRKSV